MQNSILTPTTSVYTVNDIGLGSRAMDSSGNEYIFLAGVASTAQYSPVIYDEAYSTVLADSAGTAPANDGPFAVAQAAIVASSFGWYMIFGTTSVVCNADVSDNEQVYLTTTAGRVDDANVAGAAVIGAWFRSANASGAGGTATIQLNYPSVHTDAID